MMTEYWWRSWHGAPMDHKWSVIAARSGVKAGIVSAVAWAMLDYASQHKERGTVEGFDVETYSVFSGFSEDEINAVIKAMYDKGILENGRFSNWEKRQPKSEAEIQRATENRRKKQEEQQRYEMLQNATKKYIDTDTEEDTDRDTDAEADADNPAAAPFDQLLNVVTENGILAQTKADSDAIFQMVNDGVTPQDLKDGITWKAQHNNGKAIRYVSQLIGPAQTAMAKRKQNGAGQSLAEAFLEYGRTNGE